MKILHLSKFYPPDPGGLEHVVQQLAEGAAAHGHEIRVIAATGSAWMRDPRKRTTEPPTKGVTVVRLPTTGVYWSQPIAPGYVAASRWPADVVYTHRPHPLADLALKRGPTRPTIVFHHADVQRQRLARILYQPLSRSVAGHASVSVVATRAHLRYASDLGRRGRQKARVIPYGVDVRRFRPNPSPAKPRGFPDRSRGPVGLFVGRLVTYKGLDVLLDAVTGTELRVVIVGGGPLRGWLESEVTRRQLGERVTAVGGVTASDLPAFHQAADYFVLPSTTPAEMFGVAMAEAMACERPVISTALGTGVEEVNIADRTGLVVPPRDAAALRAAMVRLAEDAQLRARLGTAGRQRVEAKFTVERMVEAHLALCEEIAAKKK